jgi:hypothetical protein
MVWKPEVWIATYAACISTGALLIQFRNWLTSRPRLRVSLISDGLVIGGDPEFDERDLVIVNATNVGTAATRSQTLLSKSAIHSIISGDERRLAPMSFQTLN